MPDIVFDFSNTPHGGGMRRISEFADYFSNSELNTVFVVHPELKILNELKGKVNCLLAPKSGIDKLLVTSRHLTNFKQRPKWLFSFGIPIRSNLAANNWFHVSNVLPFCFDECTLSRKVMLKSYFQSLQFKLFSNNNSVISGESQYSVDSYSKTVGWSGPSIVMRNGLQQSALSGVAKLPVAVTVGTHSYKRLDRAYEVFRFLKEREALERLVIVGKPEQVPDFVRSANDVEIRTGISDAQLFKAYEEAQFYLSTSQTENSSVAALEGLQMSQRVVLSDIPSHREMLTGDEPQTIEIGGLKYLDFGLSGVTDGNLPVWRDEIQKMLRHMNFLP